MPLVERQSREENVRTVLKTVGIAGTIGGAPGYVAVICCDI